MQSIWAHQTQHIPIHFKLVPAKCFSEDISYLVLGAAKDYFDQSLLHIISEEWCLISMCFILLWWTGFLVILTTLVLSQNKGIHSKRILKSSSYCLIQRNWAQHKEDVIYSASVVERSTKFYFLVPQEIQEDPKKWVIPQVLFLSTRYPT